MAGRHFTEDQIKTMAANPYTVKVTPGQISFTRKFKEVFFRKLEAGEAPGSILSDCGYDPDTLGTKRIEALAARIRKEAGSEEGFREGRRPYGSIKQTEEVSEEKRMKLLESRVEYLEAQVEFVKECMSRRAAKRQVQS